MLLDMSSSLPVMRCLVSRYLCLKILINKSILPVYLNYLHAILEAENLHFAEVCKWQDD